VSEGLSDSSPVLGEFSMAAQLMSALAQRSAIRLLIAALLFASALAFLAEATAFILHRSASWLPGVLADTFVGLFFLSFGAWWWHGGQAAGDVLLDCGPVLYRGVWRFTTGLCLFQVFVGGMSTGWSATTETIRVLAFPVGFGTYSLILATGRLQVREAGLWLYMELLPWSRIATCRWSDECTLLVQRKPRLLPGWQLQLHIPLEHKQVVAALLKEKVLAAQLKEKWPVVDPDF
jgi:hypothetical protein